MNYELTEHARESLRKRSNIRVAWMEQVIQYPDIVEPDRIDQDLEHRLGRIPENQGRVLRVIIRKNTTPVRVITVYFDRKMRRKI